MALPVAAIVCIVLACWVVIVLLLFGLYKFLKYRGSCDCECSPCGREGGENTCCKSLSESCNCCNPSLQGCLNSACPKKKISCVDIILCQCCAEPGQESCLVNTFSCCSSNCCSDGCCTCCADCDPLICCCLEIRLVSRSDSPLQKPNAAKYSVRTQSAQNNEKETRHTEKTKIDSNIVNKGLQKQISKVKTREVPKSARSSRSVTSPRIANSSTPRSLSQLQVSRKTGNQSTKMKIDTHKFLKGVKSSSGARSLPSPPALPRRSKSRENVSDNKAGARERNSSGSSDGEMVEIPVEQQNVYLQSNLYKNSQFKGTVHSSPDLILGLPLGYRSELEAISVGANSGNLNGNSSVSSSARTVQKCSKSHRDGPFSLRDVTRNHKDSSSLYGDGSISYRSVLSGSNISIHIDGQVKAGDMSSLNSPRPLPGPPIR